MTMFMHKVLKEFLKLHHIFWNQILTVCTGNPSLTRIDMWAFSHKSNARKQKCNGLSTSGTLTFAYDEAVCYQKNKKVLYHLIPSLIIRFHRKEKNMIKSMHTTNLRGIDIIVILQLLHISTYSRRNIFSSRFIWNRLMIIFTTFFVCASFL